MSSETLSYILLLTRPCPINCRTAQVDLCIYLCPKKRPLTPLLLSQNAGFLIPNTFRGLKIGKTLGKSYLIYGPKLGRSSPPSPSPVVVH